MALAFARTKAPFRDALERSGMLGLMGENHLYPTVRAAVDGLADEAAGEEVGR